MSHATRALDTRLFLPSLQIPDQGPQPFKQRIAELERLFTAAQEEISLLTSERDELVAAIKQWAKADRIERQALLFETHTQELRTELKRMRSEVKRLKRDNTALTAQAEVGSPSRQLRA